MRDALEEARPPVRRPGDAGPPLPLVAGISAGLFVASIAVPLSITGGPGYPSPFTDSRTLEEYVAAFPHALRFGALFQFASSFPLVIFAASVVARLHALGVRAAGPLISLVGGVLASAATAVSASAQWVLSSTPATTSPEVLHAIHGLVFVTGGPWHVVALGLLIAGVAVSAAFHALLPRTAWVSGVALAVVCELATLAFVAQPAAYLLPIARFGGLIWLIAAGVLLPRARPRRAGF